MGDEMYGRWVGHELFDLDGMKIGTVNETLGGAAKGDPAWLVVETGRPGARRLLVPAEEVKRAGERLSVPHTKERVENAPHVASDRILTEGEKGSLCRYYGLQYGAAAGKGGDGCVELEDKRPGG
jgi:hypothetical protein